MSTTLSAEQEREVSVRVASGAYPSGAAVIDDALDALREKEERRAELLADLDAGLASLAAGRGQPLTADAITAMKAEGRARLAARGGHG